MQVTKGFLSHFSDMMGPYGLYQHATIRTPLLSEGYCTDDNARALQMLVRLFPLVDEERQRDIHAYVEKCWEFICQANVRPGYWYNFRSASGEWLPQRGEESEDMYARVIRSLIEVLHSPHFVSYHAQANDMLKPLLERAPQMHAPRFWAEYVIATQGMQASQEKATQILMDLWMQHAVAAWDWFEPSMTYANALFPHALLVAIKQKHDTNIEEILHRSASFLMKTTIRDGIYIPIGSNGWYPKGGKPSIDNQQAIEAGLMVDFLLDYQKAYPEKVQKEDIAAVYLWFFGKNTNEIVMVDEATGACLDGIYISGPNPNNGAESMLAYQWAHIRLCEAPNSIQEYVERQKAAIA